MKIILMFLLVGLCVCAEARSATTPTTGPTSTPTTTSLTTRMTTYIYTIGCWFTSTTPEPTTTTPEPTTTTTTVEPTTLPVSLGCYKDKKSKVKSVMRNASRIQRDNMTPEVCIDYCKEKYAFAATKNSRYCFCSNSEEKYSRLGVSDRCNKDCAGDASRKCGGRKAIEVYATSN